MMVPLDYCRWNPLRPNTQGGCMNPLAWIPVAIAVLQVIKENWDD